MSSNVPSRPDDIVARLRREFYQHELVWEAADEIERLRAGVADWQRTVQAQDAVAEALRAVVREKHAEIERLRAAVEVRDEALMVCLRDGDAVRALIADEEARRD